MTTALSQLVLKRGVMNNVLYQSIDTGVGIRLVDVGQPNILVPLEETSFDVFF